MPCYAALVIGGVGVLAMVQKLSAYMRAGDGDRIVAAHVFRGTAEQDEASTGQAAHGAWSELMARQHAVDSRRDALERALTSADEALAAVGARTSRPSGAPPEPEAASGARRRTRSA